jgi:hypothetical protein
MRRAFCDAWVPGVPDAIESGWIPSYAQRDKDGKVEDIETGGPVCPRCQGHYLTADEHGFVQR